MAGGPEEVYREAFFARRAARAGPLDVSVHLTSFFRDPAAWAALDKAIDAAPPDEPAAVWSAGCSTGEEAYSLAVLFARRKRQAAVLGTDIDPVALEKARTRADVDPELRQAVRFLAHDLAQEPAPGTFHLIACRNVLMYFRPEVQEPVLLRFHEALAPGGLLVLGQAEMLPRSMSMHFETVDAREKVYRKRGNLLFGEGLSPSGP